MRGCIYPGTIVGMHVPVQCILEEEGISPWVVSAAMLVGKLTNMADLSFTLTSKVGRVEPSRSLCSYDSVLVVLWPACMLRKLGRLDPSRSPSERLHQFFTQSCSHLTLYAYGTLVYL